MAVWVTHVENQFRNHNKFVSCHRLSKKWVNRRQLRRRGGVWKFLMCGEMMNFLNIRHHQNYRVLNFQVPILSGNIAFSSFKIFSEMARVLSSSPIVLFFRFFLPEISIKVAQTIRFSQKVENSSLTWKVPFIIM